MLDRWTLFDAYGDIPHTAEAAEELARWRERDMAQERKRLAQRQEIRQRNDERRQRRRAGMAGESAPAGVVYPESRFEKILRKKPKLRAAAKELLAQGYDAKSGLAEELGHKAATAR